MQKCRYRTNLHAHRHARIQVASLNAHKVDPILPATGRGLDATEMPEHVQACEDIAYRKRSDIKLFPRGEINKNYEARHRIIVHMCSISLPFTHVLVILY